MIFYSIGDQRHILAYISLQIIWQCFICLFVQLASNNILFETIIIFNYRSSKLYNSSTSIVLNETWSIHYLDDFVQII
ncbi:unnamed protein product [Rotaria magnacalcarata]